MASAGAVATSFRQHLLRPSSPFSLYPHPLNPRQGLRFLSLLSSHFPPLSSLQPPNPCPLSLTQPRFLLPPIKSRRPFSVLASPHEEFQWVEEVIEENDEEEEEEEEDDDDDDEEDEREEVLDLPRHPSPVLSVKEKKDLASYAHSLGKKLKSQQVGKSGVTPSLISAFMDALEANELLKLKVHGNCPGELPDVIMLLEASTGSVAVGQIGRSVILYRPSISKMRQAQDKRPIRSPPRPRPFNGPSSSPGGPRERSRKPFLRRSKPRTA